MKKWLAVLFTAFCIALCAGVVAACDKDGGETVPPTEKESAQITVADVTAEYDGTAKAVVPKVEPQDAGKLEIVYTSEGETVTEVRDAGVYTAEVRLISDTHTAQEKTVTLTVLPKEVTVGGLTVHAKNEDGSTAAEYDGTPSVVGAVAGDEVSVAVSAVEFKDSLAGYQKPMKVTAALSGADAANYVLAEDLGIKGTIRPVVNGFVLTENVDESDRLVSYTVTEYVDRTGEAEIPASYQLKDVVAIGEGALRGNARLQKVTIPATVQSIGVEAFRESAVQTVEFEAGGADAPALSIAARAFSFSDVTSFTVPARTSFIGIGALQNTDSLRTVVFEDLAQDIEWETEADGSGWFLAWSGVNSLTVGDGLTFLPKNFARESALSSLTFADRESAASLGIGETAFFGTKLTQVTIPAFVTFMGIGCFQNTAQLQKVTFADRTADMEWGRDADQIAWTFAFSAVKEIEMGSGITSIPKNFALASGLTTLTIGEDVRTIEMYAFRDSELASVHIPASVTVIDDGAFSLLPTLTELTFEQGTEELKILQFAFYQTGFVSLNIAARVRYIGWAAFAELNSLTSVTFEDGDIPLVIANDAFNVCPNLTAVTLPDRTYAYNTNVFDDICTVTNGDGKAIESLEDPVFDPNYVIE